MSATENEGVEPGAAESGKLWRGGQAVEAELRAHEQLAPLFEIYDALRRLEIADKPTLKAVNFVACRIEDQLLAIVEEMLDGPTVEEPRQAVVTGGHEVDPPAIPTHAPEPAERSVADVLGSTWS